MVSIDSRKHVRVREIMNSPVIIGSKEETIEDIANRMLDCEIGSVVIMDGNKTVGIVTDRDIVTKVATKNKRPSEMLVKEVMSSPLYTISDEEDVTEASKIMRNKNIKKLGIIHNNKIMGIISLSDIVAVLPEIYGIVAEKARISTNLARRKATHLAGICDMCDQWFDDLASNDGKYLCFECRSDTISDVIVP